VAEAAALEAEPITGGSWLLLLRTTTHPATLGVAAVLLTIATPALTHLRVPVALKLRSPGPLVLIAVGTIIAWSTILSLHGYSP